MTFASAVRPDDRAVCDDAPMDTDNPHFIALHKGAFYTRHNGPARLLTRRPYVSRSATLKAEYALKQLSKPKKLDWVATSEVGQ